MTVDFAFFHIGDDISLPTMLVSSIKKTNPQSKVIQLSDSTTAQVNLTDDIQRFSGNKNKIMFFRSEAYLQTNFDNPTLFIDTDMLVIREINGDKLFKNNNYVFCERYYDSKINPNYLIHHKLEKNIGKTWKEFCPFLGCLIGAKNKVIFQEIYKNYNKLDTIYHQWNGDQMALNDTYKKFKHIGTVSEKDYAFPIGVGENYNKAFIIHFKGKNKDKMFSFYEDLFNK